MILLKRPSLLVLVIALVAVFFASNVRSAATGDLTLPSSGVKVTGDLNLYYETDATSITILVEAKSMGWVGIGFAQTMSNCDMVIFNSNSGTITVQDAYSTSKSQPSGSENQDWSIQGQEYISSSSFKVKAKRLLNTSDSNDLALTTDSSYTFNAAWSSSSTIQMHSGYISYSVKLSNNLGLTDASVVQTGVDETVLDLHKIILFYGWGIVVDLAVFCARYLKTWKHYITAHAAILFLLDVLTIIFIALVLGGNSDKLEEVDQLPKKTQAHYIMGVIILAILCIQHILGVVTKIMLEGSNPIVQQIKKCHKILGIFLYLICKANLIIGTAVSDEIAGGIIICVVSIGLMIIAEIYHRIQMKSSSHGGNSDQTYAEIEMSQVGEKNTEDQKEVMRLLNVERIENEQILAAVPSVKWIIYNQGVYDITGFQHPGGQFLINPIIGKEVGRYLNGSLPLEGFDSKPHTHSAKAFTYLKKQMIGYLNYDDSNSLLIGENDAAKQSPNPSSIKLKQFNGFTMDKVEEISGTTSLFKFRSQEGMQFKNVLKGVHWIGRHFAVKIVDQKKSRLYTQVVCMTDDNVNLRNQLLAYTEKKIAGGTASPKEEREGLLKNGQIDLSKYKEVSSTLPLIIKMYNSKGALSKSIHEENTSNKYQIQGPLGTGHGFNERTAKKRFHIFCVGTGLLPFLDLLDVLLKKSMMDLSQDPNDKKALDPFNLKYDTFFKDCEFTMYTSFNQIADFVGGDWIAKLYEYSEKLGKNLFKLHLKISKGPTIPNIPAIEFKNFAQLIHAKIDSNSFDKVYICGPPMMYNQILTSFKEKGIPADKIFNV